MKSLLKRDLIGHPIRGRIMMTLAGRALTTRQIAALLPDVPPPSLYRHLRLLLDGGAVEVSGEEGTGRAAQRIYSRSEGAGKLGKKDLKSANSEEMMRLFSSFLGILLAQFQAALQSDPLATTRFRVCAATPIVVPEEQREDFVAELRALAARYQEGVETSPDRAVFATILFPEPSLPKRDGPTPDSSP